MKFDLMFIGPATRDINIDFNDVENREIGGSVYFGTYAARAAGANVYASIKINATDSAIIRAFELSADRISLLPSAKTTLMRNQHFTEDRERRKACCLAQSDPILLEEIPNADCKLYHLAGLLYGDFPLSLIEGLKTRGMVSADMQGFYAITKEGI